MNIGCFLVSKDELKKAAISEEMLSELVKILRDKGKEWVHFKDSSIEVEGIYIPAKNCKSTIMLLPEAEDESKSIN